MVVEFVVCGFDELKVWFSCLLVFGIVGLCGYLWGGLDVMNLVVVLCVIWVVVWVFMD